MAKEGDFDFYCEEALSGKTPIEKLYESDTVLAFYHTKPFFDKHIAIVPKEHIHDWFDLPQELLIEIFDVARKLAKDLNPENGISIRTNLGKFQDTPHVHFHLIEGRQIK